MKALTILSLGLIVVSNAAILPTKIAANENAALWEAWKEKFDKKYETVAEEINRFNIWGDNLKIVAKHNVEADFGLHTYTVEMNMFADLTNEEFLATHTGYRSALRVQKITDKAIREIDTSNLPKEVDWVKEGWVTPVKQQGNCGSCWAFSATGALEGQHFNATGKLVSLSEEQLVECVKRDYGCGGGWPLHAFSYWQHAGSVSDADYPYTDETKWLQEVGTCKAYGLPITATVAGVVHLPSGSEIALQEATATVGPISIAINDAQINLQLYQQGITSSASCDPNNRHHAVLVVGYGTNEKGIDYWLVKNSWGKNWGDGGYFRMIRNDNNHCGVASDASYPISGDF